MINICKKEYLIFLFGILAFFLLPTKILAQEQTGTIVIKPQVIDDTAKASDVLNYDIKIFNGTNRKVSLYAVVIDLSAGSSGDKLKSRYDLDKETSLARWISIRRSEIDLNAGADIALPLKINVNLNAQPGKYHAGIIFSEGFGQTDAESRALNSPQPKLLINLEVEEEVVEKIELIKFSADRRIYFNLPVSFSTELKNIGNRDLSPSGFIRVYDRRGQEIENLPVNEALKPIPPDISINYQAKLEKAIFGKYKAKLSLEYGGKNVRDITEFVDFWVLPMKLALMVISGFVICLVVLIFLLFKIARYNRPAEEPRNGVINLRELK